MVHNGDTFRLRLGRIAELDDLSSEFDASSIGLVNPSDSLHQRAFAGAIFANHSMNALLLDVEGDLPQSLNTGKMLRDCVYL